MTILQLPDQLANELRSEAELNGVTVLDLLTQLLREHRYKPSAPTTSDAEITEQFDAVYATEDSSLDPVLSHMQTLSLGRETW